MGLVYAPNQPIGKGATSGNIKNFNPRLAGGVGRIGTIIKGGQFVYRFVKANRKFFTGVGAVATGAGVENLVGTSNDKFGKTYRPNRFQQRGHRDGNFRGSNRGYRRRYSKQTGSRRCCCESHIRRNMVPSRR